MAIELGASIWKLGSDLLSLIQRFGDADPSADLRSCADGDLEKLKLIQQRIRAALDDAEKREVRYETEKLWLKELKDLAFDVEDTLDSYHYQLIRDRVEAAKASLKRKRCEEVLGAIENPFTLISGYFEDCAGKFRDSADNDNLDKISHSVKQICDKYCEIAKARAHFRLDENDGENPADGRSDPPVTSSMVNKKSIFGREKETMDIVSFLLSENRGENNLSAISIFGMGGTGKTTIAQLAFNNDRVQKHFNRKGWVCVPPDYDIAKLTKSILEEFTMKPCGLTELSTLQHALKNELWQKKVLLILDGVWDLQRSFWDSLVMPFVEAEIVRIVITTRHEVVGENTQSERYPLDGLSDDECWSLFKCYAFGGQVQNEQSCLSEIGKEIVKKCDGLALAVKALACLLQHRREEQYWKDVSESELWELDEEKEILPALRLSYKYLPSHLKPLFLFCSIFPRDYLFEKDELVRLWMSHNYIRAIGKRKMEDIGQEYFDELWRRSFFDPVGKTSKYKIHDLIRSLAQFISEREFYSVLRDEYVQISDEVRHLYVKSTGETMQALRISKPNALRTLLYERQDAVVPKLPSVLPKLRCLQHVFTDFIDEQNSCYFARLIHLRYLRIYNKEVYQFPISVCQLYNLQSLNLDNCENLLELPNGIGNLVNLRYIGLSNLNITGLPESICELSNLQKLKLNDCKNIRKLPDGIGNLFQLRHLGLCEMEISELPESICHLTNLQLLDLKGCRKLSKLPISIGNLCSLLTLEVTHTQIQILPESLCNLSKLQRLNLCGNWNLKGLPNGFAGLTNLSHLELYDVGIPRLPRCLFGLPLQHLTFHSS